MAGENIEDKIISDVESNTGDSFDPTPSSDGGSDGGHSAEPTSSAEPRQREQNDARTDRRDTKAQRPDPKDQRKNGKEQDPEVRPDGKGNLVDRQGNIVAAKGPERRLQVQNERLKQNAQNLTNELAQVRQQLAQNDALRGIPQQMGLNQQDVSDAFRIAGQMKRDPVKGARMALEYALSQGAELNQIVTGEGLQNISLGAQRQMMEEYHRRANGPQEEARRNQEIMDKARSNAQKFAAENGDYEEHFDDVAKMIPAIREKAEKEGRQVDEYTAAQLGLQMLLNFARENGLNPNRSIQDQMDEIRANNGRRPNNVRQDVRQAQPRRQAPMPGSSRGVDRTPSRSGSLPANSSSDSIVRTAMAEAGYQF